MFKRHRPLAAPFPITALFVLLGELLRVAVL